MKLAIRPLPLVALSMVMGCATPGPAPQPTENPQAAVMPPIIDRELLFGDPEIVGAQLSPDGKYLSFIRPLDGVRNVWVKELAEPFDKARPVTADMKRPIPGYFWSRDAKYILFVQDQAGDENYNVFAVDPLGDVPEGSKVPTPKAITDAKGARAIIYAVPKARPGVVYVGLNDRDPAWHDLYEVEIATGKRTLLRKNDGRYTGWTFDLTGELRLGTRVDDQGNTEFLRVEPRAMVKIGGCKVLEECRPVRFHKDGQRVYVETNAGEADLSRLTLLAAATGAEEQVEMDPDRQVDFGAALFSDVTDELVGTVYVDEKERWYWKDPAWKADHELLRARFPGKEVSFQSLTRDERLALVGVSADVEPGEVYLFDRGSKALTRQYRVREKLDRAHLAEMEPIQYTSKDGLSIPGYLVLPRGVEPKGLPLLVFPHGGPWSRDTWGYDPVAQFFANRGYAVLLPNFRGSTGYGKKFLDAGNKEWGDLMQADLTWGVEWLVGQGIADPKRVGIVGGSYGGYATLAGVTFTPDLYAAAVAIVAPSNLITLLESIPPYWESIRTMFYIRMGDPRTPEGKAQLVRQSPLTHVEKIRTPLMVVQGANDPRVKKAEADQIVVALRERGYPVEYLVAPDEGHGFARPENNLALFARAEAFFARHLGGRFQEQVSPKVAERIQALTVDPKTVELPPRIVAPRDPPAVTGSLPAGKFRYDVTMERGGTSMTMNATTEIKAAGPHWQIVDTVTTPQGTMSETVKVDRKTLAAASRSGQQGPVTYQVEYKDGRATGTLKMGDQVTPLDTELGGAVFSDGAGSYQVLAALPLAEGYTTTFRNLDLRNGKPRAVRLTVTGTEDVTVPAGTFKGALKVHLEGNDGSETDVWIDPKSRKVLKASASGPSTGGATVTQVLVK